MHNSKHEPKRQRLNTNNYIRAPRVRVIDGHTNQQLGILDIQEAISIARGRGEDLIEIAPNAEPPVCKIMEYGKYMYSLEKQKHHTHAHRNKELQFTVCIGEHDLQTKVNHLHDFLEKGHSVKLTLKYKGRQLAHKEIGFEVLNKVKSKLNGHAVMTDPKLNGKALTAFVTPKA